MQAGEMLLQGHGRIIEVSLTGDITLLLLRNSQVCNPLLSVINVVSTVLVQVSNTAWTCVPDRRP